jgi:hypothetical protein
MARQHTKVWLLTITHRHGTDHWVCASETIAERYLHEYVAEWFDVEISDKDMPNDIGEATKLYFSEMQNRDCWESYSIEQLPILD